MPNTVFEAYMRILRKTKGTEVEVDYVHDGFPARFTGRLTNFHPYDSVECMDFLGEALSIPFVGSDAIVTITGASGKILYHNPLIPDDYSSRDKKAIKRFRREIFNLPLRPSAKSPKLSK